MRGVFLSSASVSDPSKGYHMEMLFPSRGRADAVARILEEGVGRPSRTHRGDRFGVCYKSNGAISDVLYLLGCSKTSFEVTNASIAREIRNNENRATNCVTRNISRSMGAGAKQIAAIRYLVDVNLLASLSPELQVTAELRLQNPEETLAELAALHDPPITKSGLNHRLEKIMAFYEKVKA